MGRLIIYSSVEGKGEEVVSYFLQGVLLVVVVWSHHKHKQTGRTLQRTRPTY